MYCNYNSYTYIMKTQTIKNILKDNKETLKGKVLKVNGTIYNTLREFGLSILDFESKGYTFSISVLKNNESISIYSIPKYTRRAMKKDFDSISITPIKINMSIAIQQFGTST